MMFDEQPDDPDIHGHCNWEIRRLEAENAELRRQLAEQTRHVQRLGQRIHNQRVALRENWQIVEMRQQEYCGTLRPLRSKWWEHVKKLSRQVSELRSQLAEREWQPIETAPKDGSQIWAFSGEQGVMRWIEGNGYALWVWCDELLSDAVPAPEPPTHWMTLPAAPEPCRHYPEEFGPIDNRQLACSCGNPNPDHLAAPKQEGKP